MNQHRIMLQSIRPSVGCVGLGVSLFFGTLAGGAFAAATETAEITVRVYNVQLGKGQLLVGLCRKMDFLTGDCTVTVVQQIAGNPQPVRLVGAPAGVYAIQVVYDKNSNLKMDTGAFGEPIEPVGFSRDAIGKMGPPSFQDASFQYDGKGQSLKIRVY